MVNEIGRFIAVVMLNQKLALAGFFLLFGKHLIGENQ